MDQKFFAAQEAAIMAALARTRKLIARYLGKLTDKGWPYSWDFNLLHDLEYRLEQRLARVWQAYFDWHYVTFGWVSPFDSTGWVRVE